MALAIALPLAACIAGTTRDRPARSLDDPADLVVFATRVRTLDPSAPLAEFVAIRGDRIAAVGARADAARHLGPATRRIDLPPGACLLPGLVDSHAHLLAIGRARRELDLVGTRSFEEVVARTVERARALPRGAWIRGRGWDQNDWPDRRFPEHAALSAAVPDHPVCLVRIDGHALLANAEALRRAGVDARTEAPPGGELLRDDRGEPTGVLVDDATALVERAIPPPTEAEDAEALAAALRSCRELGITSLHDAGVGRRTLELYRREAAAGRLTARLYCMLDGSDAALVDEWFERGRFGDPAGFVTVRAVKRYADGALGSRGALLLADYADRPRHRGLALVERAELARLARRALDAGFQLCTHAIGDAANRLVLDAYSDALASWAAAHPGEPRPDHRFRVEHAQILAPDDVPRFAQLGVLASMQSCHATSDGPWVPDRLGVERARERAYVWRSLLAAGATICNGTDAPVEELSPLRNLFSAVTRLDPGGGTTEPFFAEQCMTADEALRSAVTAGAIAGFSEDRLGMLRPGFLADLVALSVDPVERSPHGFLEASVELTIVAGRVVHARP